MLLYEISLLTSGFSLEEPVHTTRIHRMIKLGLGLTGDDDANAEAVSTICDTSPDQWISEINPPFYAYA